MSYQRDVIHAVACLYCGRPKGMWCVDRKYTTRTIPHQARRNAFAYYREREGEKT